MSTLDMVAEILREVAPRALRAKEIAARSAGRLPTTSKTPETVVSRDLAIDVKHHGTTSRFLRVDRGAFVLKEALPTALYSDIDEYACAWTRNLAAAGQIAPGVVDERSIRDLGPADVASYKQFHAFSGIAVWSRALRDAGWGDDVGVWSGSCPCTPFSSAGRRQGFADEQHLWPEWFRLIRACGPGIVVGEQVASKDGYRWLDLVAQDFRGIGYNFTATELSAAAVGAPHKRQRIYFVAFLGERRLLGAPRASTEASIGGSRLNALHTRVENETHAGRTSSHGDHLDFETTQGPSTVAYAREGGREVLGETRLHDRGQPGHDAARCSEVECRDASGVSDAAGARPRSAEDTRTDRGDADEGAEARGRRPAGDLELERDRHVDGTRSVRDAGLAGLEGGVSGARGLDGVAGTSAVDVTGCSCLGAVALGDAGLARGRWNAGAVPGAQAVGEGERIEAGDLPDEPLAPGADDGAFYAGADGALYAGAGDGSHHGDDGDSDVDTALVRGATDDSGDRSRHPYGFRPGDRIRLDGDPTWGGSVRGFWADNVEWIFCRPQPGHQDGRWRPVASSIEPLASRTTSELGRTRSARLRGYGNAINRETAKVFLEAVIEVLASDTEKPA